MRKNIFQRIAVSLMIAAGVLVGAAAQDRAPERSPDRAPDRAPDVTGIKNFLRVNEQICTGGQPSLDDLARLKDSGVKAVINLRRPEEFDAAGEAARAKQLGLRYFLIPVDSSAPTDTEAKKFLKVMRGAKNHPAFIHCASANRVGAFWMIRRVLVDGWAVDKADEEATRVGLHSAVLRQFARDYIERHAKK